MTTAYALASAALLISLVSIVIACLAYRRAGATDVIVWLQIEQFVTNPEWWFVSVRLKNRSAISLIPTRVRVSRPRSARLSAYLGPVAGESDQRQLPEAVRTSPLVKSIGERDLTKLTRSIAPDTEDECGVIIFVPKHTSRLLSVEITVRRHDGSQKLETFSAQAYLPLG
jgi:hypothetical protein